MAETESSAVNGLFLKGLPANATVDEVRSYLSRFGNVLSVVIPLGSDNRRIKRFAKVVMGNSSELEAVLSYKNHVMNGTNLSISEWVDQENYLDSKDITCRRMVFVNHGTHLSKQMLMAHFSGFGNIVSIESQPGSSLRRKRLFSFISFESEDSAAAACAIQSFELNGKRVVCKPCRPCHRIMTVSISGDHSDTLSQPVVQLMQLGGEEASMSNSKLSIQQLNKSVSINRPVINPNETNQNKSLGEGDLTPDSCSFSITAVRIPKTANSNSKSKDSIKVNDNYASSSLKAIESERTSDFISNSRGYLPSSYRSSSPHQIKPTSVYFNHAGIEDNHMALSNILFRVNLYF